MSQIERFMVGGTHPLGDNEIGVIASSSDLARDGHVLVVKGLDITNFKNNPIVLWNHNPDEPIGACTAVGVVGDSLAARIELSDVSTKSQEIRALAKAGVVKGVSIGFDVIEAEPLDPQRGSRGGMRITSSELFEISLCAIPVDTNARVVSRAYTARPGATAMIRGLPSLSAAAVNRAMSQVGRLHYEPAPHRMHEPWEIFARERELRAQHCRTVSAIQMVERERESYEHRQTSLKRINTSGRRT